MNPSIKRRQTIMANWLYSMGCKPICVAETGSLYTEFSSVYTCKSVVRISDHLSAKREYIHVIFTPLNTVASIVYKNFMWTGSFSEAKKILYTLIMSKQVVETAEQPTIPSTTKVVKQSLANASEKEKIKVKINGINSTILITDVKQIRDIRALTAFGQVKEKIIKFVDAHPEALLDTVKFIKETMGSSTDQRLIKLAKLKEKYK